MKLTRLRWRTRSVALCTLILLAILQKLPGTTANAHAIAKPQESSDYGSVADVSGFSGQNDEVYEPALLQEEVQASERRILSENDSNFESEQVTNVPTTQRPTRKLPKNFIEQTPVVNDHENITEEEEDHRRKISTEEYYDEDGEKPILKPLMKHPVFTTVPPEYVHEIRTERKLHRDNNKEATSDYTDESVEENDQLNDQNEKRPYPDFVRRKKTFNEPRPRKFFYDQNSKDTVDETTNQQGLDKKYKQMLPKRQGARNFNVVTGRTQNNDESQYDEYSEDDDGPQIWQGETPKPYSNQVKNKMPQQRMTTLPPSSAKQWQPVLGSDFALPLAPAWHQQSEIENITSTTPVAITTETPSTLVPITVSITTEPPLTPSSSTKTHSTTLQTPIIPYDTTLPTPLALGPSITTSAIATGLSSTLSPTMVISDELIPATTKTTTTSTTAPTPVTPTTIRPGGKQGKQINISRRKLQPHEKLRNYIEDAYIRMPLAVIVDPSSESLEKTKALWRDALRTNFNIKIILVSLNASGIPAAYNFNNTRQFLAGLNSIKVHAGGDAFIGVVHASELVPYDSAVFISTASLPPHTELVQDAAITLLKKRIRLYLLWFGERSLSENETQDSVGGILGEVAIRSGGDVLHIVGSENSQELEGGNKLVLVADAFRGSQEIEIPVDTTLSSLHVKIDAPTRTATLETPNGDINLKKLYKLRLHVLTLGYEDKSLDAYVPLTKLRKASIFKLKVVPESIDVEYNVFVRADRKADHFLEEMIKRFDAYFIEGFTYNPARFRESRLQSITNALQTNLKTHENIRFPDPNEEDDIESNSVHLEHNNESKKEPKNEVETFSETEVYGKPEEVDRTNVSTINGNKTLRAFESQQQQARNPLQMSVTKIEMSAQSQVLVAPGMVSQLLFEVTNTRSEAVYHNIQVVDERKFLQRLTPQSIFLRPGETTTVSVTVIVPQGTAQGTIDRITFTCHGSGTASLSLNLRVTSTVDARDTTPPTITWSFGSRCDYVAADSPNCAERFWTLDITAQDWETGILRLQSTPTNSLYYRNTYTVGSTEPLKATYAATCCEPKVSLLAYDVAGNQRSHNIDVRDIVLTEASIAAIVLGSILLLLLIILLIWGIVYCCRRRKVTLDLPTYRSHSTRSME